ncbi:MAG TPA: GNAT family N-acetyltransferase [Parvibaculum sp.]|jgi:predicted GNAT family N-acyltransferase
MYIDKYIDDEDRLDIAIRVARSPDDIMRAVAIRAIVYMAEQQCPYEEEFDGNDFAGTTHLLAEARGNPVGTLRLRFFANFGHIGRLAVLPNMRGLGAAQAIVEAAIELCQDKGYRRLYAQAQKRLVPFWSQFGFEPMRQGARPIVWSDHEYVEMECRLAKAADAVDLDTSDPLILLRPEGAWGRPGILESSAKRGATNPIGSSPRKRQEEKPHAY